jgi:hypothetical protein
VTSFRWATITDDSPLRIMLDGDVAELPFAPESLIDPLSIVVGDRVRVEISDRRVIIHGRNGGDVTPVLDLLNKLWVVTDLSALNALATAKVGDLAWMTTPGTGISALMWEAHGGSGSGLDWRPNGDVIATSATNLTNFIAAVAAIADTRFKVGGCAIVTASSGGRYERFFTSTTGALTPIRFYGFGRTIRRRAAATISSSGSVAVITTGTSDQDPGDFTYSSGTLTCVTAGTYKITVTVHFAGHATGARTAGISVNGGGTGTVYQQLGTVTSLALTITVVTIVTLAASDTVAPVAQQNSATSLSTAGSIELEQVA